jgi:phosphate transport system permease protein
VTTEDNTTDPDLTGRRSLADLSFRGLAVGAGVIVLAVLGLIAFTMIRRTGPAFDQMGLRFFTEKRWAPPKKIYGALALIWGTVFTSLIALTLAVPLSIGIALFITQVAPAKVRTPMVYMLDLLTVIPSVVFGMWGILVLAPRLQGLFGWLHRTFHGWPVLGSIFGKPHTRSFLTAGIVLAIMVTPIITSLARSVFETTPPSEKEAALALGATRWEMIRGSVIPHSKGGLVGAVMLGLGRAMGETIAVALTIGGALGQVTLNVLAPGNSMPSLITAEWGEADALKKSALIAVAVTLFVITILINIAATTVVQRSIKKTRGVAV